MPSAKILAQKQAELDVLVGKLKNANAGVLVDYSGITVEQDTKLRASFRKSGVEYKVYKNTMTSRACDEVGYAEMKDLLKGMTALAISESDPVAPAKIAKKFADDIETFDIKGGFLDGMVFSRRYSVEGRAYCEIHGKHPVSYLQVCICFAGYHRQKWRGIRRNRFSGRDSSNGGSCTAGIRGLSPVVLRC